MQLLLLLVYIPIQVPSSPDLILRFTAFIHILEKESERIAVFCEQEKSEEGSYMKTQFPQI